MEILICPECSKNSYSSDSEIISPCPHCGSMFSGRYGADRKREERVQQEIPFIFSCQGVDFRAETINFSIGGLDIKIFGTPAIAAGDTFDLSITDGRIKTKVMWVKKNGRKNPYWPAESNLMEDKRYFYIVWTVCELYTQAIVIQDRICDYLS